MDQKVSLPVQLVQEIVNYLERQPFNQVAGMISEIGKEANGNGAQAQPAEQPAALAEGEVQ